MVVFAYSIYLYKKQKALLIIACMLMAMIGIRLWMLDQYVLEELPMQATILSVNENSIMIKGSNKIIVYLRDSSEFEPGMEVLIDGEYLEIDNLNIENQFSYSEYLKSQNIRALVSSSKVTIIGQRWHINQIPHKVSQYIVNHFDSPTMSYLQLFILGNKDYMEEDLENLTRAVGISHLFAISGMHLGIIVLIINRFLHIFYLRRQTHLILLVLFLFSYNILTGFSVSIVRATLLYLGVFVSKLYALRLSKTDLLSIIFVMMIIFQPYAIHYIGFQLSFFFAFVILLIIPSIKTFSYLSQTYIISFGLFLFGLPIILSINHSIGILNPFYGPIFIIYVACILLPFAFIVCLVPQLTYLYKFCIYVFELCLQGAYSQNIYVSFGFGNGIFVGIYWLLLATSVIIYFKGKNKFKRIIIRWMIFILIVSLAHKIDFRTKVTIFDVNQGDSVYIQSPHCRLLIDTGYDDDNDNLVHYFKDKNIRRLDALILTHQHQDHIGEAEDLYYAIKIGRVYTNQIYHKLPINSQIILNEYDTFVCGKLKFYVLHAHQNSHNENNNSLVIYTEINNESWLFTGDIESEVEKQLVSRYQLNIDHLKVAHHGSLTSSTHSFIKHFKPRNVYISVGKNNYGMPSQVIIDRYAHHGSRLFSTRDLGSIEISYLGKKRYYIFYKNERKRLAF